MTAPWTAIAASAKWTALRNLDRVRPELRPLLRAHVEHLDRVLRELRRERERKAA